MQPTPLTPGTAPGLGPQQPGYLPAQHGSSRTRLIGLLMIAVGIAAWWYNWHLATTEGSFYFKLSLMGPLGVFGGILMLIRPEWTGGLKSDSTTAHKLALFAMIGLMIVTSGIDMYLLKTLHAPDSLIERSRGWLSYFGSPAVSTAPVVVFLERSYKLGSYNQKQNAMWEFVPTGEKIDSWTSLLTIVDRPDAHTREELDRLAEGLQTSYKSHHGQILMAKTMVNDAGAPYNYIVAAFEEPTKQRYELNFVKIALAAKNATVVTYSVRVGDPQDYQRTAKNFITLKSGEIGRALANVALPNPGTLPRKEF